MLLKLYILFATDLESIFHSEREVDHVDTVRTSFCTYLLINVSELTSRNIKVVL